MPVVREKRRKRVTEDVIVGAVCNQCGAAASKLDAIGALADFSVFKESGGYFSRFPSDGVTVEFVLCGRCLLALCVGFKVAATYSSWSGRPAPTREEEESDG